MAGNKVIRRDVEVSSPLVLNPDSLLQGHPEPWVGSVYPVKLDSWSTGHLRGCENPRLRPVGFIAQSSPRI